MEWAKKKVYGLYTAISDLVPHVDFEGQRLAENLFHYILLLFGAVGFAWGYACQQFSQTVYILGAGFILACLLVLPPWPVYRRHGLPWIKSRDPGQEAKANPTKKTESKKKK